MKKQKLVTVNKQKAVEILLDTTLESVQQISKEITEKMLQAFMPIREQYMSWGAERVVITLNPGLGIVLRCIRYKNMTTLHEYFFFEDYK